MFAWFIDWATGPAGQTWRPQIARHRRLRPILTLVAGTVSALLVVSSTVFGVLGSGIKALPPLQTLPTPAGPGDPILAARLSKQADALNRTDPLTELQLRIAARTLDPGNTAYRSTLAQLLLGPRPLSTVTTTVGPVTAMAFASSGRLAVGGQAGVQELSGDVRSMTANPALSAPGRSAVAVAYDQGDRLVSAAGDGVRVLSSGSSDAGPAGEPVSALVRLGVSGWAAITPDGRLVVWDQWPPARSGSRLLAQGLGTASRLAATPDGRRLVVSGAQGVTIWDVATGSAIATVSVGGPVTALAIGGDGRLLMVGQPSAASLWDIADPAAPRRLGMLDPPTGAITTVAVAPDGHSALTGGPDATMVWDLPDRGQPNPVAVLPIGGGPVAVTYRGDSHVLATGVGDLVRTWSVPELLVYRPAQVQPAVTLRASMGVNEPIRSATTNTVGSYVIVSGSTGAATVWSTRVAGIERPRLDPVATLDAPADHISAVGDLTKTTIVTTDGHGPAAAWQFASPSVVQRVGTLAESADYAAVTPDGNDAVVVSGTAATLYDLAISPGPIATLSYPLPTTALTFAPQGTALIAGHPDGSITVHTIDLSQQHAGRRHLDSGVPSPIDAVGLSADATTALGVHQDGTISAWHLADGGPDSAVTNKSAAGPGPHQAWLSPNGDFAIVTGRDRVVLWSYTDRTQLTPLATLIAARAAIPVLISADGRTAVQINPDNALTLWDLQPVKVVVDNPTARACQLADLGYQRWREIEPNPAFDTPCLPPPLPQLDKPTPSPTPQR